MNLIRVESSTLNILQFTGTSTTRSEVNTPTRRLIVVASGLSLGVEKTGPVFRLEAILQVSVDEHLDIGSLGSDGEGGDLLRRGQVAEDEWAEDGGERAPVTDDITYSHNRRATQNKRINTKKQWYKDTKRKIT